MTELSNYIASGPESPTFDEPLVTIQDTCDWVGICESTLMRLRREGKLVPTMDDGVVRYAPSDIRAYLAAAKEAAKRAMAERAKKRAAKADKSVPGGATEGTASGPCNHE